MLRPTLLAAALTLTLPALADDQVMLVLDASGSMWGQIDGVTKIEIARDTVDGLVREWKPGTELGLVAYGHNRKGDCADIETLIAPGPLDAAGYMRTVRGLNPTGMTPLSAAVIQAAGALKHSEQKATVILVSDGEETCNLDPCQVGRELEASGVDFTAHVIGFDVANPQHQAQLRCLAENTGGRYFNARNADELSGALGAVVAVSTEPALPPATASLTAPDSAPAASQLRVQFEGPGDDGDYIGLFAADAPDRAGELRFAWVKDAREGGVSLETAAVIGPHELRYVSPRREFAVLARRPLAVTEVVASLEAPAELSASAVVTVRASGPESSRHWIGFAPKGSEPNAYLDYKRPTGPTSELELRAPAEPGDYELRYVLNENERVLASRPVKVVAATVYVRGPAEAAAGANIEVEAAGPVDDRHWIGIAVAGSDPGNYRDYTRPVAGQSRYTLSAPGEPGDYEIRYVLNESEAVAAMQPLKVIAAEIGIDAPAEAAVGSEVTFRARGPAGSGNWVGFAEVGSSDGSWSGRYAYVTENEASYSLAAPTEPGDYELRFVSGDGKVLYRQALRVR